MKNVFIRVFFGKHLCFRNKMLAVLFFKSFSLLLVVSEVGDHAYQQFHTNKLFLSHAFCKFDINFQIRREISLCSNEGWVHCWRGWGYHLNRIACPKKTQVQLRELSPKKGKQTLQMLVLDHKGWYFDHLRLKNIARIANAVQCHN